MQKVLIFFFCFLLALVQGTIGHAQNNPDIKRTMHWYFGDGAGIDFSSGVAVADTNGKLHTYEGCSAISDTSGSLLFYTDGDTVWNRNHCVMPNGTGLMGCGNYGSSAQAALIVPHPGNDSLFYIFTNDCWNNIGANGFRYSVININLNTGLGDVTSKNNLLFAPSTETGVAVQHTNGKDIWVMTHEFNTNRFFAYKVDSTGLDTIPVISAIGSIYPDVIGYLRFSSNGKKLVSLNYGVTNDLFDFDASTGILSNFISLNSMYSGDEGPAFSPDGSKLYVQNSGNVIIQYCLTAGDQAAINNSMIILANTSDNSDFGYFCITPDGKLFVSSIFQDSISTINNPNNYGTSCNLMTHNFYLGGRQSELGLPNFIESYFYSGDTTQNNCDSINGLNETVYLNSISVYPNPFNYSTTVNVSPSIFNENKEVFISIYDIFGREVKPERMNIDDNNSFQVKRNNLPNGIYLLYIQINKQTIIKKLIITN